MSQEIENVGNIIGGGRESRWQSISHGWDLSSSYIRNVQRNYCSVHCGGYRVREFGTFHYPHGWLGLNADWGGCFPTIDAGIWKHHTLLIEIEEVEDMEEIECLGGINESEWGGNTETKTESMR